MRALVKEHGPSCTSPHGLYHRYSNGYLSKLRLTTLHYGASKKCVDYLLFRTGYIGLARLPVGWYCLPSYA